MHHHPVLAALAHHVLAPGRHAPKPAAWAGAMGLNFRVTPGEGTVIVIGLIVLVIAVSLSAILRPGRS